ncbi:dipeptidase [Simiduia agarivorans]|uniref:Membrane dipeptidase n=1 Tax=Simiduia agarivorans (strain DSM 21679 / JCM 13881 / BCRC 17597 / SA1) TaxID=1117647 RepID=K4KNR9_SIMAS|nr:dipeptidase [Simiduia agarivorans]AFU99890.1 membrane dipeptidase [Simiduia agarivorans SA1 = DSM 21679]
MKKIIGIFLTVALASGAHADTARQAQLLVQKYPVVDGHVDLPYRLQEHWDDVAVRTRTGDFDFERAREGGLDAPFMSIYIPATKEGKGAKALADTLIDQVEAMVYRNPEKFVIARTADDIRAAHKAGKVALPLGMENGAAIEGDLANLQHFYERGIRYITLAHSKANHISDSSYDKTKIWQGLSPFGVALVKDMNRLGVMVDVSHLSDAAFYQVLEISQVPVIASHSSLRHFTPGLERNVDDKMMKALAKNGGVLMINFGSYFVHQAAVEWNDNHDAAVAAFEALQGENLTPERRADFDRRYKEKFPYPYATVAQVADHIDRAVRIAGIDHVGLGSDYDGVGDSLPVGLKDASSYPNLVAELLKRKYPERDIAKILGGNVLRVMEANEQYAAGK